MDTTGRTIEDALDDVLVALDEAGYLHLSRPGDADRMSEPLRVLFVCTANICRSPAMELIARDLAGPTPTSSFSSAGTHARDGASR